MRHFSLSAAAGLVALSVSGCAAPKSDGLYFNAPTEASVGTQRSSQGPEEMAAALRAAGFSDVAVINSGNTIRVRSETNQMIDCGTITQVALGNRAAFPGSAPTAAIIADQQLYVREVDVSSTAQLTLASIDIYTVSENHTVTLTYSAPNGTPISRQTMQFDQSGRAAFSDGVSCVSGGTVSP